MAAARHINSDKYEIVDNKKGVSAVWGSFGLKRNRETGEIQEKVAICKKCKVEVLNSGGTTNLRTHLDRHHKHDKTTKALAPPRCTTETKTEKSQSTLFATKTDKYPSKNHRAKAITNAIATFMIKDLRPFSVVSNEGFCSMINVLDPRYDIPSRTFFAKTLIPQLYEEVKPRVLEIVSKAPSVALTTDGWTSRATESYVTITASTISADWKFNSVLLQTRALPVSHTGSNIARVLLEALIEWQIQNDGVALVTDNAANMAVAAREAGLNPHVGCYAHTLNLAAQKALKIPSVARILGRVRKIVSFFHRSTTAAAILKSKTKLLGLKEVKLVQDVSTRWNSAVDMLERYLELQQAVFATLVSKDIKQKESDVVTLDEADVAVAEQIMKCLLPLRTITTALCSETMPTLSIIRPIQMKLLTKMLHAREGDPGLIKDMKAVMHKDLSTRYNSIQSYLDETSALDPRFKVTYLTIEEQIEVYHRLAVLATEKMAHVKPEPGSDGEAREGPEGDPPLPILPDMADLNQDTENHIPDDSAETPATDQPDQKQKLTGLASILDDVVYVKEEKPILNRFEMAVREVENYKSMDLYPVDKNPLDWWKTHEFELPLLAGLARKRLCIPATSVPSERVFSTAGDIVTAQRAAIKPSAVDKLLFLKKNMKC